MTTPPYECMSMSINSGLSCEEEESCMPKVDIDVKNLCTGYKAETMFNNPLSSPSGSEEKSSPVHLDGICGYIPFRGITRETKANFMLLSDKKPPKEAWEMMKDEWGMKEPSLIISVIGGAKDFHLDDRIAESFKATIRKASQLPGSLIITGGSYTGIMKIVSDASQDCAGVCLGISAWNALNNKEASIKDDAGVPYVVGSWLSQNGLYLDYKHSHFILVNEVDEGKGETLFRAALERYIVDVFKVPAILLVVNGGSGTLCFLHEVVSYSSFPVVIVQKSGRVADLLAYGLKHWSEIMEKNYNKEAHEELFKYMKYVLLDGNTEDDSDSCKEWLRDCYQKLIECLEKKNQFILAAMGSENDIDAAVINGLLAGSNKEMFARMKLTLLWDRPDYVRTNIFSSHLRVEDKELEYLMIMALSRGNQEYVKLLMDYGVNMHTLLTVEILEFLYGYQIDEDNFLLNKYINVETDCKDFEGIEEIDRNGRKSLRGNVIKVILKTKVLKRFMDNDVHIFNAVKGRNKLEDPFWELFIWAVICNIPEMAQFLWPFGRDQMAKALIAAEVWHVLGTYDGRRHKQATITLNKGSSLFTSLALQLLDQCCRNDEKQTIKLCTTTLHHVPNMTCLDIAVAVEHFEYVAHNSVQSLLNDVWTGYMKTRKTTALDYIKIILALVFPFIVLPEVHFKTPGEKSIINRKSDRRSMKTKICDFVEKLRLFYFHTPLVTFILHFFSFIFFLCLYSYTVMMAKMSVKKDNVVEILLILWIFGYLVAEVYQIIQYATGSIATIFEIWISSFINRLDVFNLLVFFIAWAMSFSAETLPYARTIHAINCGAWILRVMTVLRVHPTLSLYLEMIHKMLSDLLWFLFILCTVILAYGVTSTSLLYPGIPSPIICLHMFLRSWFNIFGEHFVEMEPENDKTTRLQSPRHNSYDEYVSWVIMGVYLVMTNILLLNIIIAAFNTTYSNVEASAAYISKYRQYDLVQEYSMRASTPPPLSLIHHFLLVIRWLYRCTFKFEAAKRTTKLRRAVDASNPSEMERLREFEYYCAVKVHTGNIDTDGVAQQQEVSSQEILQKIETMEDKMFVAIDKMEEKMSSGMKRMEQRISQLGERIEHITQENSQK